MTDALPAMAMATRKLAISAKSHSTADSDLIVIEKLADDWPLVLLILEAWDL